MLLENIRPHCVRRSRVDAYRVIGKRASEYRDGRSETIGLQSHRCLQQKYRLTLLQQHYKSEVRWL